jgi:predicted permease
MEVWCPISANVLLDPKSTVPPEDQYFGMVVARLRSGVSREQAQVELDGIFQQNLERMKKGRTTGNAGWQRYFVGRKLLLSSAATGINLSNGLRQHVSPTLLALGGASAIVLLVACANVASLLLGRGEARYREFAVRAALGAGRGRLFLQLLHESVQLSLAGGLLGIALAQGGTAWLAGYLPPDKSAVELTPDGRVLAFSVLLATLTGLLSGLTPALRASRVDLTSAFKNQATTIVGGSQRLSALLVVGQVVLTFVLLVSAGLFGQTLKNLRSVDLGFDRERMMLMHVTPANTATAVTAAELYRRTLSRIESLPGVTGATIASGTFLDNQVTGPFSIEGSVGSDALTVNASGMDVGPRFFTTTGVRFVSGRDFVERDFTGVGPTPLIVSESLARSFFPGLDPVGRTLKPGSRTSKIIGVVRDLRFNGLRESTPFATYLPFIGQPGEEPRSMFFHVRTTLDPATVAPGLRAIVRELDPTARVTALRTVEAFIDEGLLRERALVQLSGFFSGFSLLLACLGLYGFISFGVQRRTREIGLRVALGAQVGDVVTLFLRRGFRLVLVGCGLGVAGALVGGRLAGSLLYGVSSTDFASLAEAACVMLATGLLASWLPARRAAKVDPMLALRAE